MRKGVDKGVRVKKLCLRNSERILFFTVKTQWRDFTSVAFSSPCVLSCAGSSSSAWRERTETVGSHGRRTWRVRLQMDAVQEALRILPQKSASFHFRSHTERHTRLMSVISFQKTSIRASGLSCPSSSDYVTGLEREEKSRENRSSARHVDHHNQHIRGRLIC